MTCLIVGDSIAVGLSQVLKGCYVAAQIGASSAQILAGTPAATVNFAYISSGTNDAWNPSSTLANLIATRAKITARKVVWIVPIDPTVAGIVRQVGAQQPGLPRTDRHVAFVPGPDNIHPRDYLELRSDALEDNKN